MPTPHKIPDEIPTKRGKVSTLRGRLATELGDTLMPEWRPAYDAVPRELFIPAQVTASPGQVDLDRAADPHAWVQQVKPGGVILTPFGTAFRNEGLLKLTVHDDGTASGPIIDTTAFMWLRAQQPPTVDEPDDFEQRAALSRNALTVADDIEVFGGPAAFTIGVRVPGCTTISYADDEGHAATRRLRSADSWACMSFADNTVRQLGPRHLRDEVEAAHQWWIDHDRPEITRFSVAIGAESQTIWLDDPSNQVA